MSENLRRVLKIGKSVEVFRLRNIHIFLSNPLVWKKKNFSVILVAGCQHQPGECMLLGKNFATIASEVFVIVIVSRFSCRSFHVLDLLLCCCGRRNL